MEAQDPKIAKNSPSGHHRTNLSGDIFLTKACIDNRKKIVKQQYLPHMSVQYGELRSTSGWDLLASLEHPCKFQGVSRLGSVTAWHSSSGRQPNFAALNSGRYLYSAGRPSRWALAHISSYRNYFVDSNQILHSDKDHQNTHRGWSKLSYNKAEMADGNHFFKNRKIAIS